MSDGTKALLVVFVFIPILIIALGEMISLFSWFNSFIYSIWIK